MHFVRALRIGDQNDLTQRRAATSAYFESVFLEYAVEGRDDDHRHLLIDESNRSAA